MLLLHLCRSRLGCEKDDWSFFSVLLGSLFNICSLGLVWVSMLSGLLDHVLVLVAAVLATTVGEVGVGVGSRISQLNTSSVCAVITIGDSNNSTHLATGSKENWLLRPFFSLFF